MFRLIRRLFIGKGKCNYINSTNILPPPLEEEEEKRLLLLCAEGDLEARNTLIIHNLRLVVYIAKKFETTKINIEDLISIGSMGLIKGVQTFKMDKNIKLATYASRCIDNEILMFLRKNKKRMSEVSFEDSVNLDSEGNELHIEDIFGTEEDLVEKSIECKDDKILLASEVKKLDDRDKEIIELRYGLSGKKELTQKELAEKLNISQSYISRIEKKVIKKLKAIMKI